MGIIIDENHPSSPEYSVSTDPIQIADIISAICLRAGIPVDRFDLSEIDGEVHGFMVSNANPAFTYVRDLAALAFFDLANYDGVLHFVPRGADAVAEIFEEDLIEESDDEIQRRDNTAIPRVMNLNYFDVEGQLDVNKQNSDRSLHIRGEGEISTSTSAIITADTAAKVVDIAHKVAVEEARGELSLRVPDSYIDLTVADNILYRGDRFRIGECMIGDGELQLRMVFDRQSSYLSNAVGIAPPPARPVAPISPGETLMHAVEAHVLQTADDAEPGFYVAVSGTRSSWRGALVELAWDGANYSESEIFNPGTIIGELAEPFGAHSQYYPDEGNELVVDISTFMPGLENATFEEILNRRNRAMVGNEIINFRYAEQVTDNQWRLSYHLRGRLGTAPVAHAAGERFILLTRNLLEYVPIEPFMIGSEIRLRATSLNSSLETIVDHTLLARSHIESAPAYLTVRREEGDLIINWIGVGRIGGRGSVQMSQYFTGYRITINEEEPINQTADELITTDPGGEVTVAVQQVNSLTGAGPAAEVIL